MTGRGRPKLTGSVMGQILEDAAMHFTEVGNVETALNRIDLEFDDPGKSGPPLPREVVRRSHQPRALIAATRSSVVISPATYRRLLSCTSPPTLTPPSRTLPRPQRTASRPPTVPPDPRP